MLSRQRQKYRLTSMYRDSEQEVGTDSNRRGNRKVDTDIQKEKKEYSKPPCKNINHFQNTEIKSRDK